MILVALKILTAAILKAAVILMCLFDFSLEMNDFLRLGEGGKNSGGVFEIEHHRISVIRVIERLQGRIGLQHGHSGLPTVVFHQLTGNAKLLPAVHRAKLYVRIGRDLSGYLFLLAGLNIQLSFNMRRSKRAHPGLVAFFCGKEIVPCFL